MVWRCLLRLSIDLVVLGEAMSHSYFHILAYNEGSLASHGFIAVKSIMTSVALTRFSICEGKIEK